MKKVSGVKGKHDQPPTFRERMLFAIWLAGKVLGVENSKQFAKAIGKGASQLSKWVNSNPRPALESIKLIATAVGISAAWLDDPKQPDAREPADFPVWLAARRAFEQEEAAKPRRSSGSR